MKKYKTKPQVIQAEQWTDFHNPPEGVHDVRKTWNQCCPDKATYYGMVYTAQGSARINLNEWLIFDSTGYRVIKDQIFQETYELADYGIDWISDAR